MASNWCWLFKCPPPPPPRPLGTPPGPVPEPEPIMPTSPEQLLARFEDALASESVHLTSRQLAQVSKFTTIYQSLEQGNPKVALTLSAQLSQSLSKADRTLFHNGFTEKAKLYRDAGNLAKAELAEKVAQSYAQ